MRTAGRSVVATHSATMHRASLIAALVTMVVWGANFTATKVVLAEMSVASFLFLRFLWMPMLGFAALAWIYRGRWREAIPLRADWPRFIACGLIGHTVHVGIVTWGINLSTAFSSALVLTSGPIFTLLILAALGGRKAAPAAGRGYRGGVFRHSAVFVGQICRRSGQGRPG